MNTPKHLLSAPEHRIRSFTLLELIVVVIVVGILASLGFARYSKQVERSRVTEAVRQLTLMRELVYEYYLKNASLDALDNSDLGVTETCDSSSYFNFHRGTNTATAIYLKAVRCTSAGKSPNASREYTVRIRFFPQTGEQQWTCTYTDDNSGCYGYSSLYD